MTRGQYQHLVCRNQSWHLTMLPASYAGNHPALNTSSSLTTNSGCSDQVRGRRSQTQTEKQHRVRGCGMRRGGFARSEPHLLLFRTKEGLVDLEKCAVLRPVANHTGLFLIPLCFVQLAGQCPAPSPQCKEAGWPRGLSDSSPELPFSKSWWGPEGWVGPRLLLLYRIVRGDKMHV